MIYIVLGLILERPHFQEIDREWLFNPVLGNQKEESFKREMKRDIDKNVIKTGFQDRKSISGADYSSFYF